MDLKTSLTTYSQEVNNTLKVFFTEQEQPATAIDDSLVNSLKMLRDFSLRGGKAVRPYLVKLGFEIAGGKTTPGLTKAAASTDLHHKHILILDDIADRDQERYGGPTLEWAYKDIFKEFKDGEHRARTFAMLDGVWLGALARELLSQSGFEPEKILKCQRILNTLMFRDTLAGWQIHALECDRPINEVTPEEFIKGLELVTARYTFEGPFKMGLTLAGNQDEKLEQALTTYSQKVGTAFQIHDDILGLFGDTKKTGKPVGNDIREGKKTLLVQIAYKHATSEQKVILERSVGDANLAPQDLALVQQIVKTTGSLEYSQKLEKDMISQGIEALAKLPDSQPKQLLTELAQFTIVREK